MNAVTSQTERTAVVVWRSIGPYHVARMRSAALRLAERGIRTVAVELCDSESTRDWKIERQDVPFELITLAPGSQLTEGSANLSRELRHELQRLRVDYLAVAGYDRPEMRAALAWGRRSRRVCVLLSETKWDDRPRRWWRRWLTSRIVGRADAALASGGAAGEYLVSVGMPREFIFRHYGAVDNDYFARRVAEIRAAVVDENQRSCFLACGRLIERRKNIKTLLRAYAAYRAESPGNAWNLVVCGDGEDRAELERCATAWCGGGVKFVGFQQVDELVEFYARAGCFVHPAVNEAWGLVINEAMASGLPVLVSRRCGSSFDLVHEGRNGYTFNPHDHEELARLLRSLAEAPAATRLAMGRHSREVIQRFGCDAFAGGLESAFRAGELRVTGSDTVFRAGAFQCRERFDSDPVPAGVDSDDTGATLTKR